MLLRSPISLKGSHMPDPRLHRFFTASTENTVSGALWGCEIETHFVYRTGPERGQPIRTETTSYILAHMPSGPWNLTIDLGRQLLELIVAPHSSPKRLLSTTLQGLESLYSTAARVNAMPVFEPFMTWPHEHLLWVQEERDEIWLQLDGPTALEQLCRVASVQFTVSINPSDAISTINRLWASGLHATDYTANDQAWRRYIVESHAQYEMERYGGPTKFSDLNDYLAYLERQVLVMYRGQAASSYFTEIADLQEADIRSFVGTIWPHYRLRVHPDPEGRRHLALEMRPFSRRTDSHIAYLMHQLRDTLGF